MNSKNMMNKSGFTIEYTNAAKGIAILVLLFHHLFYSQDRYDLMQIYFRNSDGVPCIQPFAFFGGAICVYTFLILSGFGLFRKLIGKMPEKYDIKIVYEVAGKSLIKTLKNYWFAFGVFVTASILAGRMYPGIDIFDKIKAFCADFFGLSFVFGTYSMNGAWWYMTALIFSYLLVPVFCYLIYHFPRAALIFSIIIAISKHIIYPYHGIFIILYYANIFWLGMLIARYGFFDTCVNYVDRKKLSICAPIGIGLILFLIYLRYIGDDRVGILLAIALILVPSSLLKAGGANCGMLLNF